MCHGRAEMNGGLTLGQLEWAPSLAIPPFDCHREVLANLEILLQSFEVRLEVGSCTIFVCSADFRCAPPV